MVVSGNYNHNDYKSGIDFGTKHQTVFDFFVMAYAE